MTRHHMILVVVMKNKFDVCIVGGLGHIGLPLGIVFASKGLRVCLQDINEKSARLVKKGILMARKINQAKSFIFLFFFMFILRLFMIDS